MGIGELCLKNSPADITINIKLEDCKETEADVAAEFYYQCRRLGLLIKMEVKLPSKVHRSGFMRADALIFQLGTIVCAVEFKGHRKTRLNPESRQYKAYCEQDCSKRHRTPCFCRKGEPVTWYFLISFIKIYFR